MTKNDFILEYALRHRELPSESLLDSLWRYGAFEVENASRDPFNCEHPIRKSNTVVCKTTFVYSNKLTLPKGFVFKVCNVNILNSSPNITAWMMFRRNGDVKGDYYHINLRNTQPSTLFRVVDPNTPLSVLDMTTDILGEKKRGGKIVSHTYTVDDKTLLS